MRRETYVGELIIIMTIVVGILLVVVPIVYFANKAEAVETTEITLQWEFPANEENPEGFKVYVFELVNVIRVLPGDVRQIKTNIKQQGQTCFRISAFNAENEAFFEGELICHGLVPVQGLKVVQ